MSVIVKVQRPLASTEADAPWMIYDKGRERVYMTNGSNVPAFFRALMGDDYKAFFYATLTADEYQITSRAPEQDW